MTRLIMVLTLAVLLTGALVPNPTSAQSLDSSSTATSTAAHSLEVGLDNRPIPLGGTPALMFFPPAVDNGGCSRTTHIRNSRVQSCISRPYDGVVAPDGYVRVSWGLWNHFRRFQVRLMQDLPYELDKEWTRTYFPYTSDHIGIAYQRVTEGRYYTEIAVIERNPLSGIESFLGRMESPRQIVYRP